MLILPMTNTNIVFHNAKLQILITRGTWTVIQIQLRASNSVLEKNTHLITRF